MATSNIKRIVDLINAIKAREGKIVLAKALSVSVLNQVVSSGTNFALGVYLVRMLPPSEFGLYGIGFAISLFYFGIGHSLFLTQMVVHTPEKHPDDRVPYAGRMFLLVSLFCAATILLIALLLLTANLVWESVAQHTQLASAIMAASITYLLKDFFVRHAYNVRRESLALLIHAVIACTMAVLLWLQYQYVKDISVELALRIYAVAQASGAILGYISSRLPVANHQRCQLFDDLDEAWHGGKWASITNLVYFARTQAHTIVVASLLGPVGVATLNAARLLVTPAIMVTPALSQVTMPRLAAARSQGDDRLKNLGRWVSFALLVIALLYSAILLGGYGTIVNKIYGEKYQEIFMITVLWCLYACLLALRNGAEMTGQVLKEFKYLSSANTYSTIITLIVSYSLTVNFGLFGAMIGLILGEIVLIILISKIQIIQK